MEEMTKEEFDRQKDEAAKRIRDMYRGQNMPPYPDFISIPKDKEEKQNKGGAIASAPKPRQNQRLQNNIFRMLNFSELLKSEDALLILGIIFILLCDNADEKLILALVFIML